MYQRPGARDRPRDGLGRLGSGAMRIGEASARELGIAALVAACAVGAGYEWIGSSQAQSVRDAFVAGAEGRYHDAISDAQDVSAWPAVAEAHRVVAFALEDLGGRDRAAVAAFDTALRDAPNDWVLYQGRALALLHLGQTAAARRDVARVKELNPRVILPPVLAALATRR
jgi:tetratricopeptide (TPR) repeat protein